MQYDVLRPLKQHYQSHHWALLDKALNLSSMSPHSGFLRGWSSWAFLCVWISPPHFWAITWSDWTRTLLLQACSSHQFCKTRWLRSSALWAERCHERGDPEKVSPPDEPKSLYMMLWWSVTCLSAAHPHPNCILWFSFQMEVEESEPWAGGAGRANLWWNPAGVHPSPWSHSKPHGPSPTALRISCWCPHTFITLSFPPSLQSQLPPSIWHIFLWLSAFHQSCSSLLPFAAECWGVTRATAGSLWLQRQAHISSPNSSCCPSSKPEWLHPLPSTQEMPVPHNPWFLQDGDLGQPSTAPEHHSGTSTTGAEPLSNPCMSTGAHPAPPGWGMLPWQAAAAPAAHGGHTQLLLPRQGALPALPCSQPQGWRCSTPALLSLQVVQCSGVYIRPAIYRSP